MVYVSGILQSHLTNKQKEQVKNFVAFTGARYSRYYRKYCRWSNTRKEREQEQFIFDPCERGYILTHFVDCCVLWVMMVVIVSSERLAIEQLTRYKWNLEVAVDEYFANPPEEPEDVGPTVDVNKIASVFSKYTNKETNVIDSEGLTKFFGDLGIDPNNDILTFVIAWQFEANSFGEFTKEEFIEGMKRLKCESIADLKNRLDALRALLFDDRAFKEFYLFLFDYCKPEQQKVLGINSTFSFLSHSLFFL